MTGASAIPLALVRRRRNPVRSGARRDLAVAQGDELRLAVSVWEADGAAGPLDVTGARLALSVLLRCSPSAAEGGCAGRIDGAADYAAAAAAPVLWQGWGTVVDAAAGWFDVRVPGAVTAGWGGRYRFVLQLDYDGSAAALAQGVLHVLPGPVLTPASLPAPFVLDEAACDGPNLIG